MTLRSISCPAASQRATHVGGLRVSIACNPLTLQRLAASLCTTRFKNRQPMYNVTSRCVRTTIVAVEKQRVLHVLTVYAALGIRHAMRMRLTVVCGLSDSCTFFDVS